MRLPGIKKIGFVLLCAGMAGGAAYLYLHSPYQSVYLPQCAFYRLTGWYCPGCGATRAMYYLLHLQVGAAFRCNPMLVLALPYLLWGLWRLGCSAFGMERPIKRRLPAGVIVGIFCLVMAFWGLRNVPVYPFTLLAPPGIEAVGGSSRGGVSGDGELLYALRG